MSEDSHVVVYRVDGRVHCTGAMSLVQAQAYATSLAQNPTVEHVLVRKNPTKKGK